MFYWDLFYTLWWLIVLLVAGVRLLWRHNDRVTALARVLLPIALVAYLVIALCWDIAWQDKLYLAARDLLLLGAYVFALSRLTRMRYYGIVFFGTVLALFLLWGYRPLVRGIMYARYPGMEKSGELLIELKEGESIGSLEALLKTEQISYQQAFSPQREDWTTLEQYYILDVPLRMIHRFRKLRDKLAGTDALSWQEINESISTDQPSAPSVTVSPSPSDIAPNDPRYSEQWGHEVLGLPALHDWLRQPQSPKPVRRALVVILDTGVEAVHPDLASNYRSFSSGDDTDAQGHGTHCAGIAGAVSSNGIGVAGMSYGNDLLQVSSVKVLNDRGSGSQVTVVNGIIRAADLGADVISISLGGFSTDTRQKAYSEAVAYAAKRGAIVVVAAGNNGVDAVRFAPANAEGVIAVSAIDATLDKAAFSNTVGSLDMKLAAPGTGILSTYTGGDYRVLNGTSMATPFIAGLVGILKAMEPGLDAAGAYTLLRDTGRPTRSTELTGTLPDALGAVQSLRGAN